MGKLIKHILHIPLSPQTQPPSCSINLTNSEIISHFQKDSGFLDSRNTPQTYPLLSAWLTFVSLSHYPWHHVPVQSGHWIKNGFLFNINRKNFPSILLISLPTTQFHLHIQSRITTVALFPYQGPDSDEVTGHCHVLSWKKKKLALCSLYVKSLKDENSEKLPRGQMFNLGESPSHKCSWHRGRETTKQGNNIKDGFPYTKRKENSKLTSISLLIIHHSRMKYADDVSSMKLEKEHKFKNQMNTNVAKCQNSKTSGYCTFMAIIHLRFS